MKKRIVLCLSLVMLLSFAGCRESTVSAPTRVAALKGPTAMGMVRMMHEAGETSPYAFSLAGSADEVSPLLLKGELDIACVPANLAAILAQKSGGGIVTLAVNTLGVLYIVETGESIRSISDLAGKRIVAAGMGSTPEYALGYLLGESGTENVTVDWKNEHSECVAALAAGQAEIALLPQPFVTVAQGKIENLRVALDLTEEWDALDNDSALLTGVVVARRDFAEQNPKKIAEFLLEYAASVAYVNENPAEAAQWIGEYGIVDAAVAEKAIPFCNIVCITGEEMKKKLSGYLEVLYEQNADAVGGALPGEAFYYGA